MTTTRSTSPSAQLPADFEEKYQAWYKAVAGVFARVSRKDISDIPEDVWKKLIYTTYEGIDVNPLYTRADDLEEVSIPGEFPFIRGFESNRDHNSGWGVTETFGHYNPAHPEQINKQLLAALFNGTTNPVIDFRFGLTPEALPQVLDGVLLDLVPLRIIATTNTDEIVEQLHKLIAASKNPHSCCVEFSASPLTSAIDGTPSVDIDTTVKLARRAAQLPGQARAILVDGVAFSNQGASDAQEIGLSLAAVVEYIRLLERANFSVPDALKQLSLRYAVTDDQFNQIAKFRAARGLLARITQVLGYPQAAADIPQHALTAPVMFSQRDPWVNMLRSTVAAFAAGVGGATDIEILPFDHAVIGGMPGTSRSFAHRIARNTNLLLLEESHLGFVVDPGGGSYYLEQLTEQLAEKAWKVFQTIEAEGGLQKATESGYVASLVNASYEKIREDIAHRRKKITGINEFPNLLEKPLAPEKTTTSPSIRRWAEQFEALRNRSDAYLAEHGHRPQITLVPLGPLAKHNIRTGFTTNLLASGGIEAINPGQLIPGTPEFAQAINNAHIVVLCAADQEYKDSGGQAVAQLKELGVSHILAAGSKKTFADFPAENQPDDYLNLTIDAASYLNTLLERLGG